MVHKAPAHPKKRSKFWKHLSTLIVLGVAGVFFVAGLLLLLVAFMKLPDFKDFTSRKIVESTKIYDRTGKVLLYDVHQDMKRTIIPFESISQNIKDATVAVEDANFYEHPGVRVTSIVRAAIANFTGRGFRQGGSTITQQVVKKTLLTDEKLVTRKIKEIILSFKLEQAFSKNEILGLYLNEVPYGGNVYGIAEATNLFFHKDPSVVTIAESAYLAAIPNAPTYYSPYGNHRDKLDARKNFVLFRMKSLGLITEEEYQTALKEKVEFFPREPQGIKAPHFVMWVKEYLAEKYGEQSVEEKGYKVITTLDYELQQKAEEVVARFGASNEEKFGAKNMGLIAIDPKTGQVLAMVGSRDYFDVKNGGNFNVTLAPNRQPGSTFKPFVYATAFMKGFTPETVLFDVPTNFNTNCDAYGKPITPGVKKEECYMPENYDLKYRGPVSLRDALAQSLNIPAVKTLYLAGLRDSVNTARTMGITSLTNPDRFGLTLVLGGGEVSLIDLVSGYSVFANDGVRNKTTQIIHIEDKQGNIVEEYRESPQQAIPSNIARMISDILTDNKARTPGFGANSALYFPNQDVAAKTGSTNDYRDMWTVGYTPTIAVGMWAGNNDNSKMEKKVAGMVIAPVWHAFMEEALKIVPNESFPEPEEQDLTLLPAPLAGVWQGGEKHVIDTVSGNLATESTPIAMKKIVVVPSVHTILHWINKNDPTGPQPTNPQNDPQYELWETPVRAWALSQGLTDGDRSSIPTSYDTTHANNSALNLSISGLDFTQTYNPDTRITLTVTGIGNYPLSKVELFINGNFVEQVTQSPFSISFIPKNTPSLGAENTLTITGYDSISNKTVYTNKLLINTLPNIQ